MIGAGWRTIDSEGNEVFRRWHDYQEHVDLSSVKAAQLISEAASRIEKRPDNPLGGRGVVPTGR
jgi:hypothetical protein